VHYGSVTILHFTSQERFLYHTTLQATKFRCITVHLYAIQNCALLAPTRLCVYKSLETETNIMKHMAATQPMLQLCRYSISGFTLHTARRQYREELNCYLWAKRAFHKSKPNRIQKLESRRNKPVYVTSTPAYF